MEILPNLLLGRKYHGCASFVQNGKKVSINYYLIDMILSILYTHITATSILFIQILLVTGGWGRRGPVGVGYHDETEIFQGGQWRNVGKLPNLRRDVKCGTLNNTVFLTGIFLFSLSIKSKFILLKVVWTPPSFPEPTS